MAPAPGDLHLDALDAVGRRAGQDCLQQLLQRRRRRVMDYEERPGSVIGHHCNVWVDTVAKKGFRRPVESRRPRSTRP